MASTSVVYKYQFVSEPDDALKCLICLEVAEEPWQHGECGKLFCKTCLDKLGMDKPCSNCRGQQPQYFKDSKSKREIKALGVMCDNVNHCEWVGTIGTLEEHVATCKFALLPCPKECEDSDNKIKHFMRKDLDEHLEKDCPNRDHTCEYCGEKGTYAFLTGDHDKTCPKKIIPCPNDGCTDTMPRQQVEEHVTTECEYTKTPCKYRRLGCDTELKRKDMVAHEEDDKLHLHMAIDITSKLEDRIAKLESKNVVQFKFTNYQKRKDENDCVRSPAYYTTLNGYNIVIEVFANGTDDCEGTHVSVYASFLKGLYRSEKTPFIGTITFTLLNQLHDSNHIHRILELNATDNAMAGQPNWGCPGFIPHSELGHDPVKNTQYLKDDTLYFKMSVEVGGHKPWLE